MRFAAWPPLNPRPSRVPTSCLAVCRVPDALAGYCFVSLALFVEGRRRRACPPPPRGHGLRGRGRGTPRLPSQACLRNPEGTNNRLWHYTHLHETVNASCIKQDGTGWLPSAQSAQWRGQLLIRVPSPPTLCVKPELLLLHTARSSGPTQTPMQRSGKRETGQGCAALAGQDMCQARYCLLLGRRFST